MAEPVPTIRQLVDRGAARLRGAGLPDPRREAWRLWSDLAEEAPGAAALRQAEPADAEVARRFQSALARRAAGEPLAYVTGLAGFRHLVIRSDRRALIPRPETEGLVELMLAHAPAGRIVDVGTGSGCVALALAQEGRYGEVLASDLSPEALALARWNRDQLGLPVRLVRGDLLEPFGSGTVDAVIANPPYLTEAEHAGLDRSVRDWEPAAALVAGADGMCFTERLLRQAARVVRPGGWIGVELDSSRAQRAVELARAAGWQGAVVHDDLFGRARYLLARRSEAE